MTTSPSQPEPLSVRIARAKGCEPAFYPPITDKRHLHARNTSSDWRCECKGGAELNHAPQSFQAILWSNSGYEAWLTPAASFALLAEMVDAQIMVLITPYSDHVTVELLAQGDNEWHSVIEKDGTLPEAIAEAWLAWRSAK